MAIQKIIIGLMALLVITSATAMPFAPAQRECRDVTRISTYISGVSGSTHTVPGVGEDLTFELLLENNEWFLALNGDRVPLADSQQRLGGVAVTIDDVFVTSIPTPQASAQISYDTDYYTAFVELDDSTVLHIGGVDYVIEFTDVTSSDNGILVNGERFYVNEFDRFAVGEVEFFVSDVFTTSIPFESGSMTLRAHDEFDQVFVEGRDNISICGLTAPVSLQGDILTIGKQSYTVVEGESIFIPVSQGTLEVHVQDFFATSIPTPTSSAVLHAELHKSVAEFSVDI